MTLQTALSGLLGAQTGLNTVSNNLANASTTAFKSQTALFEDVYPAGAANTPGIGTATEGISSDFTQGNLTATGNPLDAAIQGNGYFVTSNNGTQQYTRDGAFQIDSTTGQMVTASGAKLLGYPQTAGGLLGSTLAPITINTGAIAAKPTGALGLTLNLNSGDAVIPTGTAFSANQLRSSPMILWAMPTGSGCISRRTRRRPPGRCQTGRFMPSRNWRMAQMPGRRRH